MNADSTNDTAAAPLLLDSALPEFRFARLECVLIAAEPLVVYRAARALDLLAIHSPLFDLVTWARGVPDRLCRRPVPTPPSMRVADLFDTVGKPDQPWVPLGENPGRDIVFGAVGKVWKPAIEWRRVEPPVFAGFDEPGWAKMAAAFVVHPYGTQRSLLIYEARIACTDPESTARFRPLLDARLAGRRCGRARNASGGQEGGRGREGTVRIRGCPKFWRR
ncbi:hypothetical protein HRW23_08675 [Streptomyces lunaelactis]|uniref:hypothetical protein n=1 Tax=Streptomyces lunaelactis TaxID=1535768 RepID=UPI001585C02B|nr:hypothetical protein [Streptomyces lunaelactis]NUK06843.1 hypothetical protein [Streptomyces lunaelactis]NUK70065.1 hypothetical protein [Streptomyces lunaelactis]NUK77476.1 hypothetical protein [Streptomyces lunaelactis]NUL09907.1 hypothetical protein [Streptomyces lunaelactis]NUL21149.1 hypothetical protein [Streptomyces lunaelactis]